MNRPEYKGRTRTIGRPPKADKKTAISLKLPPYLIEWLDRQPESRAFLIENALTFHYQIPEVIKNERQSE